VGKAVYFKSKRPQAEHRARIDEGRADMPDTATVVHSDPEILGGTPVFVGTLVPFRNLIGYLERNHRLDQFLDSFPSVSREQAVAALEAAHEAASAVRVLLDEQLPR
jgi:uncharacterized protein (DUF433 family)